MFLSRADKEKRVIELHKESKSIREIAAEVHMSFSDISAIINKTFDEPEGSKKPIPSKFCAAVKLFKKGANPTDAIIKLDLTASEAESFYADYWRVERMHSLHKIHSENNKAVQYLLYMHNLLKKKRISSSMYEQVVDLVEEQIFRKDDQASLPEGHVYSTEELERAFYKA